MNCEKVIEAFHHYNKANQVAISRAEFEKNLTPKMELYEFTDDVKALVADENMGWNPSHAYISIMDCLVSKLQGQPWKKLESKT